MKKQIITLLSVVMFVITLLNTYSYANSATVETTLKQDVTNDGEIQVEVSISSLKEIGEGINVYSGELIFNSNELALVKIESKNNWNTPLYSEENAKKGSTKVVATSNQFIKETGAIFIATFEKKTNNVTEKIKFNDFEVAAKVNGKTIKVTENKMSEQIQTVNEPKNATNLKKKIWEIISMIVVICLLFIGLLSFGFAYYRKNKGGE